MIDLLKKNGPFYKANMHCHTTRSDGRMTPEQVKQWYKSHGYSAVAFTDHSLFASYPELQDEEFLAIAGAETQFVCLNRPHPHTYKTCHLNFWAKDPEKAAFIPENPAYDIGQINRYIEAMKKNGFLCGLNHPAWSYQGTEDVLNIRGVDTFEVYNHGAQILCNKGENQVQYAMYLNNGHRAWAVATDDNHSGFDTDGEISGADDTLGGWIQISMPELTYSNFMDAFENGRFYASNGPEFYDLYIDEERDMLVVRCSPVRVIIVKGIYVSAAARAIAKDDSITYAEFPMSQNIRGLEPLIHVEIATTDHKWASSQPYWFE